MGPLEQCCGTVMIYCGSGSYFDKVLVPVPAQVPVPVPDPDLTTNPSLKWGPLNQCVVEPWWFIAVPVPTLKKVWFRFRLRFRFQFRIQYFFSTAFQQQKTSTKSWGRSAVRRGFAALRH